jgi:predicted ABC-type ATPase
VVQSTHAPQIFVLAGTNGAGKSSVGGATIRARGGQYFNPDEAAARIRQAQPHLSATQANSAAWHEGKRLLQHAIAQRLDYNFETTLGGKTFSRLLTEAAKAGFQVRIWYVGLASPEQHLARIRARVRHGGHDIPELDVRRRFDHSRLQLIALLPHLAELRVYDNSDEASPQAGQAPRPRLVLHWLRRTSATDGQPAHGDLRMPATPADWAATPEWARPLVAAAGKCGGAKDEASPSGPAGPRRASRPRATKPRQS